MGVELYVDGDRWREHLRSVAAAEPGLIPVAKGNGYGFGLGSLARRVGWLGCDMVAVGTYREVAEVEKRFHGDIMVLEPWRPWHSAHPWHSSSVPPQRVVHTVGRPEDLVDLASRLDRPRV